ncbi:MAG: MazG nucleotide pyrophosphohydrolase domain-containing protein [Phycisphaeraceae bacterium]|nr:MazG nucleotide pyrophosphohydrolase domain-containing protein [Phycisphaeraceae bacterium]
MPENLPSDSPLTLAELQELIRDRYYATDAARGTPGTFMWLVEEVGELATALQKAAGEGGNTSGDSDVSGEFADVLAWLCTLANINDVDLEEAVRSKYVDDGAPEGHK